MPFQLLWMDTPHQNYRKSVSAAEVVRIDVVSDAMSYLISCLTRYCDCPTLQEESKASAGVFGGFDEDVFCTLAAHLNPVCTRFLYLLIVSHNFLTSAR